MQRYVVWRDVPAGKWRARLVTEYNFHTIILGEGDGYSPKRAKISAGQNAALRRQRTEAAEVAERVAQE